MTDSAYARRIGAIRRDLIWVADRWEDVHEVRLKGTSRPYRTPTMSDEAHYEASAQARVERAERSELAPGEHPSPVHVDVLDLLADILMRADMLHEHVAQTVGEDRLPPAASAFDDATPYLRFIGDHLLNAAEADSEILDAVSDVAVELKDSMSKALGEFYDGQTLSAECRYCGGRTTRHPIGGQQTLRVRLLWMPTVEDKDNREPVIVCEGMNCAPPESDCGMWHHGRPAWPMAEWDWLAQRLNRAA